MMNMKQQRKTVFLIKDVNDLNIEVFYDGELYWMEFEVDCGPSGITRETTGAGWDTYAEAVEEACNFSIGSVRAQEIEVQL